MLQRRIQLFHLIKLNAIFFAAIWKCRKKLRMWRKEKINPVLPHSPPLFSTLAPSPMRMNGPDPTSSRPHPSHRSLLFCRTRRQLNTPSIDCNETEYWKRASAEREREREWIGGEEGALY